MPLLARTSYKEKLCIQLYAKLDMTNCQSAHTEVNREPAARKIERDHMKSATTKLMP